MSATRNKLDTSKNRHFSSGLQQEVSRPSAAGNRLGFR